MKQLKRVLIANDSMAGLDVALAKATLIEHYTGAELELAEVVYDTIAEEPETLLPPEQRARLIEAMKAAERNGLRNLLEPIKGKVASIEPRVVWSKDAARGLLEEAGTIGADLIIKPASAHHPLADLLHTPLDWELMRGAACAVLISKQRPWNKTSPVLAAATTWDPDC